MSRSLDDVFAQVDSERDAFADDPRDRLYTAIVGRESSGGQLTPNKRTGALGIGQVLPDNVRAWSRKHLGRELTPEQFAAAPDLQARVVRGQLGDYFDDALKRSGGDVDKAVRMTGAMWYGGPDDADNFDDDRGQGPKGDEPSFRAYTSDVLKRYRQPGAAGGVPAQGRAGAALPSSTSSALDRLPEVEGFYRSTFGRDLPVTARGQSQTHNRLGWDHRNSADVGLNPNTPEGQALTSYLTEQGIPFLAFDHAIPGKATGPHIHIGERSHRLGANPAPATGGGVDLDSVFARVDAEMGGGGDDDEGGAAPAPLRATSPYAPLAPSVPVVAGPEPAKAAAPASRPLLTPQMTAARQANISAGDPFAAPGGGKVVRRQQIYNVADVVTGENKYQLGARQAREQADARASLFNPGGLHATALDRPTAPDTRAQLTAPHDMRFAPAPRPNYITPKEAIVSKALGVAPRQFDAPAQNAQEFYARNPDAAPEGYNVGTDAATTQQLGLPNPNIHSVPEAVGSIASALDSSLGASPDTPPTTNALANFGNRFRANPVGTTLMAPIALAEAGQDASTAQMDEGARQMGMRDRRDVYQAAASALAPNYDPRAIANAAGFGEEFAHRLPKGFTLGYVRPQTTFKGIAGPGESLPEFGGQVGEQVGELPYFLIPGPAEGGLLARAGVDAAKFAGIAAARYQDPSETTEQRGRAIEGGAVTGALFPMVDRLVPKGATSAIDRGLERVAPGLAGVGERLHSAGSMVATNYGANAITGQPLPTFGEAVKGAIVGAAIGPSGYERDSMVRPTPEAFARPEGSPTPVERGPVAGRPSPVEPVRVQFGSLEAPSVGAIEARRADGTVVVRRDDGARVVMNPAQQQRLNLRPHEGASNAQTSDAPSNLLVPEGAAAAPAEGSGAPSATGASAPTVEGPAVWRHADGDQPVTVTGDLGVGPDGRRYVSIEGSQAGVPADEVHAAQADNATLRGVLSESGSARQYLVRDENGRHGVLTVGRAGSKFSALGADEAATLAGRDAIEVPASQFDALGSDGARSRFVREQAPPPGVAPVAPASVPASSGRDWSLVPSGLRPRGEDPHAFDDGLTPTDYGREQAHARAMAQRTERAFRTVSQNQGPNSARARDLYDAAQYWRAREQRAGELAGNVRPGRGRTARPGVQVLGANGAALPATPDGAPTATPSSAAGASVSEGTPLSPEKIAAMGRTVPVTTSRGTKVEAQYALVDMRDLTTSHDRSGNENPAFPSALQPRDRTRTASAAQIKGIASGLDPERLGENYLASDGAPIIGPDGVVESGNGRTLAIQEAYSSNPEAAARYRDWLKANADRFGYDPAAVDRLSADPNAMPGLVRIRRSDVDRVQFAKEANEQSTAAMSAAEQAQADAAKLSPELLATLKVGENGELGHDGNTAFTRAFLGATVAPSEMGRYVTADGALSQDGVARIQRAIIARAYGTADAVEALSESTDSNVKNVLAGMTQAAPRIAVARANLSDPALDIGPEIGAAMRTLSTLRAQGQSVADYLRQGDMFGGGLSPIARDILVTFDENSRRPKAIRAALEGWADTVDALADPRQMGMFGPAPTPEKADIIAAALARAREVGANEQTESGQRSVLAEPDAGEGSGAGRPGDGANARPLDASPVEPAPVQTGTAGSAEPELAPAGTQSALDDIFARVDREHGLDGPEPTSEPAGTSTRPSDRLGLTRSFRAGDNAASVTFADGDQRDLYDLGSALRRRGRGGQNKTSERANADIGGRRSALVDRLKLTPAEVDSLAYRTHSDVREQMQGIGDGEGRAVVDNVRAGGEAPTPGESPAIHTHRDLGDVEEVGRKGNGNLVVKDRDGVLHEIQDPASETGNARVAAGESSAAPTSAAPTPEMTRPTEAAPERASSSSSRPARERTAAEAKVKPANFWNFDKANLSTEGRAALEDVIRQTVAERGLSERDRKPMSEVRAAAGDIAPEDVAALGRENALKDAGTVHPEIYLRGREVAQGYAREAAALRARANANRAEDGSLLPVNERDALLDQADRLESDARAIVGDLIGARTEIARNFGYLKMTAGDALAPDTVTMRARRVAERSGMDITSSEWGAREKEIGAAAEQARADRDADADVTTRMNDLLRRATADTPDDVAAALRTRADRVRKIVEQKGGVC